MAIKYYENNPRKDGYKGIRVSCTVNGKPIQEYFHQTKDKEAKARHVELMVLATHRSSKVAKATAGQYTYSSARYKAPRRTGVVGMTIGLQAQLKCSPVRYYPVVRIACHDKARGVRQTTTRIISSGRGLEKTWKESCRLLSQWRGYTRVPRGWYSACPSVDDFKTLRRFYNRQGFGIALENLRFMMD